MDHLTNLKSKSVISFFWDFFGKMANNGIGFIISIILARLITPEEFGLIAIINIIILIATVFLDSGLGTSLIQRKRLLPIHYSSVFYFNIIIGALLTLLTYFSATTISNFYSRPELINLTKFMSFSFIISSLGVVQNSILNKKLNFKQISIFNLTSSIIGGILGIGLAYFNYGVWSLAFQIMISRLIFITLIWFNSKWKPDLNFSFKALRQLWSFGFRIFLSRLIDLLSVKIDVLIIGKIFSPNSLGFYQRAKSLEQMIIQYSSGSLNSVIFPILSQMQNDTIQLRSYVLKTLDVLCFIVFFLLGIVYLCSEEIVIILFTEKWLKSIEYLKILLLSSFVYPLSALYMTIISSRGNSKAYFKLTLIKKIGLVVNLFVGFNFGITGFLYGFAIVRFISLLINIFFVSKELKTKFYYFIKPILPLLSFTIIFILIINLISSFLPYITYHFMLFAKAFSFSLIYMLYSYLLKLPGFIFIISKIPSKYLLLKQNKNVQ